MAELREPTAEERDNPIVVSKGFARAPSDGPPGAAFDRSVRVVARIESLDRPAQCFMLKGPLQGMVVVHVDDAAVFAAIRVGQAIVANFNESLTLIVDSGQK